MALKTHKNRYRVAEGEEESLDAWLMTYADMITLLVAFFVILISMSTLDRSKWEQMASSVGAQMSKEERVTPLAKIKHALDSLLVEERTQKLVSIDMNQDGILMQFASRAFYGPGQAEIGAEAQGIIDRVASAITGIGEYPFRLDVEGHTDNAPISTVRFPSNWELSSSRATNIVKYLVGKGFDPNRLKAAGYADTRPVVANRDSTGRDNPEHQATNRRIVIHIY